MSLRAGVPWYARIAAKLVLSRLPTGYAFWRRFDVFSHGTMDDPSYALRVFRSHYDAADFARKGLGFVVLELGPGDSTLSAVVARAHGASASHLVDAGRFATEDIQPSLAMATYLREAGLDPPALQGARDLDDVLARCGARYETRGLESLRALPAASVDLIWSQAVLEHVRRGEFPATMKELRRILRPDGVCSHTVDLKDHLGGGLNNMRLPSAVWEKEWMARSGFYTNRLRCREMLEIFEASGFAVERVERRRWNALPIRRAALAREFGGIPDDELLIKEFDVVLRPA